MKFAIAGVIALVCLLVAVTYVALEFSDVAIVETQRADGTTRQTHVWYARDGRRLWLEAGSASNGWFVDIQQTGELTLSLDSNPFRYETRIDKAPAVRVRVRKLLRKRYGWRDWWVSFFVDQASAIPVQLVAVAPDAVPRGRGF